MTERTDSGKGAPKRGPVLLDSDRTVEYVWRAEDNWDEWKMDLLYEINDRIRDLIE
jgi:hypothetical protein